jgi:hypothetical protein
MKVKKHIFRVGEAVKIVTPETFLRVGYPKTKKDIEKELTPEQYSKIDDLLREFGLSNDGIYNTDYIKTKVRAKVIDAIAYGVLYKQGYGGRDRTIHTENLPELAGRTARIQSKKVVRTGKYEPGTMGCDSDGYNDYDPAYLSNCKSHVILELDMINHSENKIWSGMRVQIEEKNVESVRL